MTTFDEHSRDEVFRDYLNEARAAKDYAASGMDALPETADRLIGRGQIHATLAHAAAATLLAAMPETEHQAVPFGIEGPESEADQLRTERDALRDRVDELVAQGLTEYKDAGRVVAQTGSMPEKHEPGTEPLCTCDHAQPLHYGYTGQCRDCTCATYVPNTTEVATTPPTSHAPGTAPLCTCGHHLDRHQEIVGTSCYDCKCAVYTPNTTEVDGWSEPAARGARFRVARFEQNGHVPPVYFKVTDQLGKLQPEEFPTEAQAQLRADLFNHADAAGRGSAVPCAECGHLVHAHLKLSMFGGLHAAPCCECGCPKFVSTSTDASVETEAQPESPATALVDAAYLGIHNVWSEEVGPEELARVATIAVLRALAEMNDDVFGNRATSRPFTSLADELEQHTDTPTTE